jgi:hypothetical protein
VDHLPSRPAILFAAPPMWTPLTTARLGKAMMEIQTPFGLQKFTHNDEAQTILIARGIEFICGRIVTPTQMAKVRPVSMLERLIWHSFGWSDAHLKKIQIHENVVGFMPALQWEYRVCNAPVLYVTCWDNGLG